MNIETNKYSIQRYDISDDKSLKSWSAADEFLLKSFEAIENKSIALGIYNDRFGFLSCSLHSYNPSTLLTHKSQEKAIKRNLQENGLDPLKFSSPLLPLKNKIDIALVKIPKSLGLFRFFLEHITNNSSDNITVTCSFMTRNFNASLLKIAAEYFEGIEQSRALKKARLITLTKKKAIVKKETVTSLTSLNYNDQEYQQYLGVFSGAHIDYATEFYLKHIEVKTSDERILDLASGNGIIGNEIHKKFPEAKIDLMDDSLLAVASAELNVQGDTIHHHTNDELSIFDSDTFDLIVTNPPFHFEYEINMLVPLELFKECHRCLKKEGNLQIVANRILGYKPHLIALFSSVKIMAENKKFIIYQCFK